eukprot:CAMPEP_0180599918 /NCGR_PEP_ID=MMETSP1037_2-20121125/23646_1 /TAXON_ID=632150 /ORGANISM="Azadinium spinosum, Strain 3D9" /LENGTH=42 /DNA_ID= /DNA_START= /DNA_END= /DNA_ORIENTATION=
MAMVPEQAKRNAKRTYIEEDWGHALYDLATHSKTRLDNATTF